jgi:tricorn protease
MTQSRRAAWRAVALCAMFAALVAGAVARPALHAQSSAEPIKFAHVPHIANDGRIAFSYHEDIWLADPDGSNARRLTANMANDVGPRFSPDGKWIAFTSNRSGNNDVFVIPSAGGEARQLTYFSGDDQALYWMPDGKSILVSSSRGPGAFGSPLHVLPLDGSPEEPVRMSNARLGMVKQDGTLIAYNRALPSTGVWRKAFRGNSAPGLIVQDLKTGDVAELTNANVRDYQQHVNDVYPMWGADGMIYFASERDGTYNLWRIAAKGGTPQQVTHFKTGGVFYPSISPDGKKIIFQHDFDLWTLEVPGGGPKKMTIPLAFDHKDNDLQVLTTENLADGFSPSPNGDYVAVDFHGDIQIVPSEQGIGERTPVATTPWRERNEEFSPDGKKIAYVSDESGDQEVWVFDLATATRRRLTNQPSEKVNILWAASSQKLAYTGDNRIWEVDLAAAQPQPRELASNVAGGFNLQQYSGDGTWLLYSRRDEDQNSEIYLYDIAAKKEYNVTHSPNGETSASLTPDGKTVVFTSDRDGAMNQLFTVSLAKLSEDPNDPLVRERIRNAAAAAGGRGSRGGGGGGGGQAGTTTEAAAGVAPGHIDLDGIEKRANQITRGSIAVTGFFLSSDGRTVYFATGSGGGRGGRGPAPAPTPAPAPAPARGRGAATTGADDQASGLFAIGIDGRDRRTVASGSFPGMKPTTDRRAVFFRASASSAAGQAPAGRGAGPAQGQEIHRLVLAPPQRNERVSFSLAMRVDRRAEWKQMFEETWRVMKYRYYRADMNGYDWAAIKAKYEPLLQYVGTNEDVYDLGNAMIGELSSSHTGVSGPATRTMDRLYTTRFLGFEIEPAGGAYRINHIYRDGPADKEWFDLKVGDYVLAIDGVDIKAGDNYWKILSTTSNEYIPVKVSKTPDGKGDEAERGAGAPASKELGGVQGSPPSKQAAKVVRIASVTNLGNIRYDEFVANNRDIVDKATNGQIAYVHIRAMDQPSLERFRSEIDRYWNKKGIIIDVRYNTGGNIDEELLDIIERRPYMFTNPRSGARTWGRRPLQAIAGPKVMLINQRSFSDGEATPMGFRTLDLGRIVGTPTAGGVIWTGSYALINGGSVRTPGSFAVTYDPTRPNNYGINLENYGVPPDVWVQNTPVDEVKGVDRELQAAIDEVMRMLKASPGQKITTSEQ